MIDLDGPRETWVSRVIVLMVERGRSIEEIVRFCREVLGAGS